MSSVTVRRLNALFRVCSVRRGGLYFEQGGLVADLYIVSDGAVKLVRVDGDGRQVTLRIVTRPEPFGFVAALTGCTNCSAQALTETEALMLEAATFLKVMASYRQVAMNVSRVLATWVADSWERLDDLSVRRHVGQRLARALLRCTAAAQRSARSQHSTTLALSHQDLADIVGASVFSVSRVLSAWKRMGIVDVKRGRVVVQWTDGLAAMAESRAVGGTNGAHVG